MSLSARIAVIAPVIAAAALLFSSAASAADKADAEAQLIEHITQAKRPNSPNDMAQIKNLVDWILEQ
jgi:hypothetical protein